MADDELPDRDEKGRRLMMMMMELRMVRFDKGKRPRAGDD